MMFRKPTKDTLLRVLYFLLTMLIIAGPALYNRYPLVYSDTGSYIGNAADLIPTFTRPIGYSLFIRLITWQISLWTVVFAQSLLISFLTFRVLKLFIRNSLLYYVHSAVVIILALFTGAAWYASLIMPDIFTAVLVLSFILFVFSNSTSLSVFYGLLIFLSTISHLSHFPVLGMLVLCTLLMFGLDRVNRIQYRYAFKNSFVIAGILVIAGLFTSSYNYYHHDDFALSRSSHVFFMGRLNEMGILKPYLKKNCPDKGYKLCDHIEDLPRISGNFLWSKKSPLHKTGGFENSEKEYDKIIRDILTTPDYFGIYAFEVVTGTFKQLLNTYIGAGLRAYKEKSAPYWAIRDHFRSELNFLLISEQSYGSLDFQYINIANYILMGFSFFVILLQFPLKRENFYFNYFLIFVILGVVFNAMFVSSLANVFARLQARVMWLIPFLALVALFIQNQQGMVRLVKKCRIR